jgi:hypothetical protein
VLVLLSSLAAQAGIGTATADRAPRATPLLFHPAFSRVGSGGFFMADGHFVFLLQAGMSSGVLIDEHSRQTRRVARAGCSPDSMGGPWLLFRCGDTGVALYGLSTHRWTTLAIARAARLACAPTVCSLQTAIGSTWIQLSGQQCNSGLSHPGPSCNPPVTMFQNIQTGQVERDPAKPGGRIIADLNSRKLGRRLCSPLRVPAFFDSSSQTSGAGTISVLGRFAIATTTPDVFYGSPPTESFLERCGSTLHERIAPDTKAFIVTPAANHQLVLWQKTTASLTGIFLPSLRRFSIALPTALNGFLSPLVVASQLLYVQTTGHVNNEVWTANLPAEP